MNVNSKKMGWWSALGILVVVLVTEALPVVFGTGYEAKWDWGFIYVTIRFVLTPIICVAHLVWITIGTAVNFRRGATQGLWLNASSVLISAGYLIALYLQPLPWLSALFD